MISRGNFFMSTRRTVYMGFFNSEKIGKHKRWGGDISYFMITSDAFDNPHGDQGRVVWCLTNQGHVLLSTVSIENYIAAHLFVKL